MLNTKINKNDKAINIRFMIKLFLFETLNAPVK